MPALRLGNTAPDFSAETTAGPIKFHDWIGDSWVCMHAILIASICLIVTTIETPTGNPLLAPR